MNYLFKLYLTLNSLLFSLFIFLVDKKIVVNSIHPWLTRLHEYVSYFIYGSLLVFLSWISIGISNWLSTDTIEAGAITEVEPANDAFLPTYLGYFFVALSVPDLRMFIFTFGIIFIFIFNSRISYFNPLFFLFKFTFYYAVTNKDAKILLITRRQLKEPRNISFNMLKRINNYTFIDMEKNQ